MSDQKIVRGVESFVFRFRGLVLLLIALATVFMGYKALQTEIDAGFEKQLPKEHRYMETYLEHRDDFGGANRIQVALIQEDGDMFNGEFFNALKNATDDVFFIPGVERGQVTSLFTPNVRYREVTEEGFAGGDVIPADFQPAKAGEEEFATIRENIIKAGIVGRLVTKDFDGAMIRANLLDINPETGKDVDYRRVAQQLEEIRSKYESEDLNVHIIGFAKVVGDVAEAITNVVAFFFVAVAITALVLLIFTGSLKLTVLPLATSIVAVIWQFGLLNLLRYGIDPMSILVPFLVFAIAVSHGVQMVNGWMQDILGADETSYDAARAAFRRLLVPGTIALVSDTIGFFTIMLIDIALIRETALTAALGVAVIILTNLFLLPILMSYVTPRNLEKYRQKQERRNELFDRIWNRIAGMTERGPAVIAVLIALALLAGGLYGASKVQIGDLHAGVPELRQDSRYNRDARAIVENFDIGVDVLSVYGESVKNGCTMFPVMDNLDRFSWTMENVEGVQSVISLAYISRQINAAFNEGNPQWRILPRNKNLLVQSIYPVETDTGLLNHDCSIMPAYIFTEDHKATTIDGVVSVAEEYNAKYGTEKMNFALAGGNVGVMAATNDVVEAAQVPMLAYVYAAVIALVLVTFRTVRGTLCIIVPLALVSVLTYAVMTLLEIGLKVSTLPVAALGVGIGVDYGIYVYSQFDRYLREGNSLRDAYFHALQSTGRAVLITGLTLAIGVATWLFSALQFQADMGLLLTFMFLVNMIGAVFLLPALAHFLINPDKWAGRA